MFRFLVCGAAIPPYAASPLHGILLHNQAVASAIPAVYAHVGHSFKWMLLAWSRLAYHGIRVKFAIVPGVRSCGLPIDLIKIIPAGSWLLALEPMRLLRGSWLSVHIPIRTRA